MFHNSSGRSHGEGRALVQMMDIFSDEDAAIKWFESVIWADVRNCSKCGSRRSCGFSDNEMPQWCSDCQSFFSVKMVTALQSLKIRMGKWAIRIYLCITSLKSVSSMKLHRDLGVSQPTEWAMMHLIREAWACDEYSEPFDGPVEFDETCFAHKRRNKSNAGRRKLEGRGSMDVKAVVGGKCRESKNGPGVGFPFDRQGHAARLRGRSDRP